MFNMNSRSDPQSFCPVPGFVPEWKTLSAKARGAMGAFITTRGESLSNEYGFNMGLHVGDDAAQVHARRCLIEHELNIQITWLNQVHGIDCVDLGPSEDGIGLSIAPISSDGANTGAIIADAAFSADLNTACAVMTADCLPVLFCADDASVVAAAHAGWRGLLNGVLENTLAHVCAKSGVNAERVHVYFGPAIGPASFEVGDEVRQAFAAQDVAMSEAFVASPKHPRKWLADLYLLATIKLREVGVRHFNGGGFDTHEQQAEFFSYRRQPVTGRMASLIWRR
jgi:YfiH family protein